MLARPPLAFTRHLGLPVLSTRRAQSACAGPPGKLDHQRLLPSAQRRVIRHRPVQPGHLDQARHQSRHLPQRQVEQRFQRQAQLNGAVRKSHRPTRTTTRPRQPVHLRIKPCFHRSAPLQRCIILLPVRRAISSCGRFGHHPIYPTRSPQGTYNVNFAIKPAQGFVRSLCYKP